MRLLVLLSLGEALTMHAGGGNRNKKPVVRKQGDWTCSSCSAHNFANRMSCFRCGVARRKRKNSPSGPQFCGKAVDPRSVVDNVIGSGIWWLGPKPDLDALDRPALADLADLVGVRDAPEEADLLRSAIRERYARYALGDVNFRAPTSNPRIRAPSLCEPEVYEDA